MRLVDLILFEALLRGASDVHLQPARDRVLVRYRLDGILHTVRELPPSLAAAVVGRVKVIARLDLAERRIPQDGRAGVTIGGGEGSAAGVAGVAGVAGRSVDLRIAIIPSTYGERVVLRLLDPVRTTPLLSFAGLGMPPALERSYLAQVDRTQGIVLSTGPTGSGKTTTLYTTLAHLSRTNAGRLGCELNIVTIEDPVEYDLTGLAVSQMQVDPHKNVTFASGLRHLLRQDPDVIMVGEVRDGETARIAVQASLTGHLVLSTLHTNDAAGAIARLIDLGIEPFLLSSALSAILAQRLLRTLHRDCGGTGIAGGGACAGCVGTGFKGRTAIFELLIVDGGMREMIARRAPSIELLEAARRRGMLTLREAGEALHRSGTTTMEEVARIIEPLEEVLT